MRRGEGGCERGERGCVRECVSVCVLDGVLIGGFFVSCGCIEKVLH